MTVDITRRNESSFHSPTSPHRHTHYSSANLATALPSLARRVTPAPDGCGRVRATRRTLCLQSGSGETHARTRRDARPEVSLPSRVQRAAVPTPRSTCPEMSEYSSHQFFVSSGCGGALRNAEGSRREHLVCRTHMRPTPDIADWRKTPSTVFGAGPMSGMLSSVLQ